MATANWIAVFKAEYYTTTSKFRKVRRWIPVLFVLGVVFFSYYIRAMINLIIPNGLSAPPISNAFVM